MWPPAAEALKGCFIKDTRYVSDLRVLLNGHRPLLLSSTVQDNNAILKADLANPDLFLDGRLELPRDVIHVVRSKFLWDGACFSNSASAASIARRAGLKSLSASVRISPIFSSFGASLASAGARSGPKTSVDGVTFSYFGLDGVVRRCLIRFDPGAG